MIQAQTQTAEYWGVQFSITDSDIEQLYNRFLEVEKPQTIEQLTRVLFKHRVAEEIKSIRRLTKGRLVYKPQNAYEVGDELVFPALDFLQGSVSAVRKGFNPEEGSFNVIAVEIKKKTREFASEYDAPHPLNVDNGRDVIDLLELDADALYQQFGPLVVDTLYDVLSEHPDFIELSSLWFVEVTHGRHQYRASALVRGDIRDE